MTAPLPRLVDCAGLMRELGVKRTAAEAIMRAVPKVKLEGHAKIYVKRSDVEKYLAERTAA